ncbi:CsbD family protein [Lentzea sp. BCCO 10_0798]|uniref:CsbD family protein n=1 Tax=Lentzea kristufekii TaxID=3095430 RepID=A0ABU4TSF4_9PSEU|nr:CsbD family protein [Lentzea sp. BCCO 10_0798]MDX8050984.1 CsbD family protein [Lentzea sp. BCCO 10_0798]
MSLSDKISNKAEDLSGKVKETAGEVTGDDELRGEGIADQAKAAVKDVVEDVKDALGAATDKVKAALHKD